MTDTVAGYVPVFEAADRLPRLLAQLAALCDEVVVAVDVRSSDGSADVARRYTDRVVRFDHDDQFAEIHRLMVREPGSAWVLRVDDDETLSPNWTRERLAELFERREITHYFVPRRWVVPPGDRYVCQPPVWPNAAMRFFRNAPGTVRLPRTLHEQTRVAGTPRFLADLTIDHWNYVVYDRAARERKLADYERAHPGGGGAEYYLFEDYHYQTEPLGDRIPERTEPAGRYDSPSPFCADVRIVGLPSRLAPGESYFVELDVINRSRHAIEATIPYDAPKHTNFAVRWVADDGTERFDDTVRTPLYAPVPAGGRERALVHVRTPNRPGRWWIQGDIVTENVAWFSRAPGAGYHAWRLVEVS